MRVFRVWKRTGDIHEIRRVEGSINDALDSAAKTVADNGMGELRHKNYEAIRQRLIAGDVLATHTSFIGVLEDKVMQVWREWLAKVERER